MDQYKLADKRFKKTGAGLKDSEFPSFHAQVINNVCPWYEELHPILKDRPNVYPCFTNESGDEMYGESVSSETESDESIDSSDDNLSCRISRNNKSVTIEESSQECTSSTKQNKSSSNESSTSHTNHNNIEMFDLCDSFDNEKNKTINDNISNDKDSNNTINLTTEFDTVDDDGLNNKLSEHCNKIKSGMKKNKERVKKKAKLTPSKAKELQQSLLRKKKRQIHTKSTKDTSSFLNDHERKERQQIIECSKNKMILEEKRHKDLKEIEEKKIIEENKREEKRLELNKERLALESKSIELKNKKVEMELERDAIIQAQERKKLVLLNVEVFKARQDIKKNDPTVSDEFLNQILPMDI
jgi:hypothetical protein